MAENSAHGMEKGENGDATVAESQPTIPPVAKGPVNTGEDSAKPSTATETATDATTDAAAVAPSSEPAAQNDATGTATLSKEEVTEKINEAEKLAEQPEKPADSAPAQTTTTMDTATAEGPSLTNGEAKEPPKPATVEEIRDQEMPAAAPSQPAEMTGALPAEESAKDAPKIDAVPGTDETQKSDVSIGDKRKLSDASNEGAGDATDKPIEDEPVEKKQKTNGTTNNGPPKKVGRPKKDKTEKKVAASSVGRTARKTRSQGAAD
ncbi:hypothetical protein F5B19DRAFT_130160 [Rostrohypoxylon terebratum]|nr:hypothetical protein F5B19DRAFT_130160 [Rostrohypoxylon terebratum]